MKTLNFYTNVLNVASMVFPHPNGTQVNKWIFDYNLDNFNLTIFTTEHVSYVCIIWKSNSELQN